METNTLTKMLRDNIHILECEPGACASYRLPCSVQRPQASSHFDQAVYDHAGHTKNNIKDLYMETKIDHKDEKI